MKKKICTCVFLILVVAVGLFIGTQGKPKEKIEETKTVVTLLRDGDVLQVQNSELPVADVGTLLQNVFRNPTFVGESLNDPIWEMRLDLQWPGKDEQEQVLFRCGVQNPELVELRGSQSCTEPILVKSKELWQLVQCINDPKVNVKTFPEIDDATAYERYQEIVTDFLDRDFTEGRVKNHSVLTQFLAVQTGPHPLGMEVYYIGFYTQVEPKEQAYLILKNGAYADSQLRVFDLEPRQCLVTINREPIGFVSEQWLRDNQDRFSSRENLRGGVQSEGISVFWEGTTEQLEPPVNNVEPEETTKLDKPEEIKPKEMPSFGEQAITEAGTNGMHSHTYEFQRGLMEFGGEQELSTGLSYTVDQFYTFSTCFVSVGENLYMGDDGGQVVPWPEAYILVCQDIDGYYHGFLGSLPLPVDESGMTVAPQSVVELENGFISYVVEVDNLQYCYTVNPGAHTVSMQSRLSEEP